MLQSLAQWRWVHSQCYDDSQRSYYYLEEYEFDDVRKALRLTLDLMEKTWLPHTTWREFVMRFYNV